MDDREDELEKDFPGRGGEKEEDEVEDEEVGVAGVESDTVPIQDLEEEEDTEEDEETRLYNDAYDI